ncbi:MAG: hypothetical protein IKW90_16870 [Lachnospiraceae bacterium]|nr:hypothetical protein [Lachnospiraceae bacterium]
MKPPKKPTPSQSGITVETETTSAETTVASTSPSTTASRTTTAAQTTAATTAVTTASARQSVTTVRTTATAARTTRTAVSTTAVSSSETTSFSNTTSATDTNANTTTAVSEYTTTTDNSSSGEFPLESPKSEYDIMLEESFQNLELIDGLNYSMDCYYATDKQVGEHLFDIELEPTEHKDCLPSSINAKVYEFKNSVHEYQLIVKFEGSEEFYPYVNFDYLRQIINTEKEGSL